MKQQDALAACALVALKAATMLYALHCGFQQVSDDDYARTVIAQTFVHAPRLDPSGTSWLPLPFWLYGSSMMVVGRSLTAARVMAFVLGALSPLVVYAGLRSMTTGRASAFLGTALGALTPWSVWLGLAPVPEGWAGSCAAAALFFLVARRWAVAGGLVLVASLSRYEAWPVVLLVAAASVVDGLRGDRTAFRGAAIAVAGPVFWLANNAITHHDAFHFLTRVTSFHDAHVTREPLGERLLAYPLALVHEAPDVLLASIVGIVTLVRRPAMRASWRMPLLGAAAVLAFLVAGNLGGGAPTHHAVRALMPVAVVLGALGGLGIADMPRGFAIALGAMWLPYLWLRVRDVPGSGDAERRDAQIARGRALASPTATLEVTPCAYEHFALIAAFAAPERVVVAPAVPQEGGADCPRVTVK